jgi:isopentenyl diphosphate isomerase/L-lactate dehydrogenase-like FMN-dependent dehydrogenase
MMRNLPRRIRSVEDAEFYARRRLPRGLVQQVEGGSGRGTTIAANLAAFDEVLFRPRAAVSFPSRSLATSVVGHRISLPVLTAPVANLRLYHRDGEVGVARAAGGAGTIACIGAFTGYAIEDVAAVADGALFFQLYYLGGRNNIEPMIERIKRAGVKALILTVDSAAWMTRERPVRRRVCTVNGGRRALPRFAPQVITKPRWLSGFLRDGLRCETPMALRADGRPMPLWEAAGSIARDTPVWEDIPWIRELFGGPVIVKGILSAEDARRAAAEGAAAVIVSNHGGNALDGTPASLRVLPEVVDAVGHEIEVLLDGGIRRGSDVVKAVALGARAVLLGRACVWAHAAAGGPGVAHLLELFRRDIDRTLALAGCPSVEALDGSYVRLPREWEDDRLRWRASAGLAPHESMSEVSVLRPHLAQADVSVSGFHTIEDTLQTIEDPLHRDAAAAAELM